MPFERKGHIITSSLLISVMLDSVFIQLSGQDLLPISSNIICKLLVCIQQLSQCCNGIRVPFSFLCWFAGTAQVINDEFFLQDLNIPTTKSFIQKRLTQNIRISI